MRIISLTLHSLSAVHYSGCQRIFFSFARTVRSYVIQTYTSLFIIEQLKQMPEVHSKLHWMAWEELGWIYVLKRKLSWLGHTLRPLRSTTNISKQALRWNSRGREKGKAQEHMERKEVWWKRPGKLASLGVSSKEKACFGVITSLTFHSCCEICCSCHRWWARQIQYLVRRRSDQRPAPKPMTRDISIWLQKKNE